MSIFSKKNQYRLAIVLKKASSEAAPERSSSIKDEDIHHSSKSSFPDNSENSKRFDLEDDVEIQWLNSFSREEQLDGHWLKQFKNVQEFEPTFRGRIYYWYQNTVELVLQIVQTLSYRNKNKIKRFNPVSMAIYIILCIADIILTLIII